MSDKPAAAATTSGDPLVDALKAITSDVVKGLGNKISVEGASFPATILAYRGMARAAGTIAGLTRAEQPKCVLVQTWDDRLAAYGEHVAHRAAELAQKKSKNA